MCTSIKMKSKNDLQLLARTMDFSFDIFPDLVVIPRNKSLAFKHENKLDNHYGFVGLSKNINGTYIFADGVNEHGLAASVLYFQSYATYNKEIDNKKINLAPEEMVAWVLANYKDTNEVKTAFSNLNVLDEVLPFIGGVPPFHWVFNDELGNSIIVEPLPSGIKIHDNTLGVMANAPDLDWHITNARNYIAAKPQQLDSLTVRGTTFTPFGQGSGTFGLPGDLTSPARFIRTLYNSLTVEKPDNEDELVIAADQVLNSVKIPKGSVITQRNTMDYTQYISFMVSNSKNYYFKLYNSTEITKVSLSNFDLNSNEVIIRKLHNKPVFNVLV